ncbi:hypothetical protein ColTof4_01053 [Colletotrichum tofieldiae]|nr:hypothetical protein ColTof3_08273 [Colletotrichum tofieldiae]GKT68630.1 hypothetical protein ColTof4_01053 [Colletotrichum tofieldiae]
MASPRVRSRQAGQGQGLEEARRLCQTTVPRRRRQSPSAMAKLSNARRNQERAAVARGEERGHGRRNCPAGVT